jgi:uncharacterized membrane protein YtjA (UPF0391 family)
MIGYTVIFFILSIVSSLFAFGGLAPGWERESFIVFFFCVGSCLSGLVICTVTKS